jgi:hypothetical protein
MRHAGPEYLDLERDRAVEPQRLDQAAVRERLRHLLLDPVAGLVGMQQCGRTGSQGVLDHHRPHPWRYVGRPCGNAVVAGGEHGRDTGVRRQRGVQTELADRPPVTAHVGDDPSGDGVGHHRARGARLAEVADEHHSVGAGVQAGHHAPWLGRAAQ